MSKSTNEQEFQGQVLAWWYEEISRRPGMGLEGATQESPKADRKRNDAVVWINRAAGKAFLTMELKTPATPLNDPKFLDDACEKAARWGAPYFIIWNMQGAELYRTPEGGCPATPKDRINPYSPDPGVAGVEDWLDDKIKKGLRQRALRLLEDAWEEEVRGGGAEFALDAAIFVDRLSAQLRNLRALLHHALRLKAKTDKATRLRLRAIAAEQGFLGFVDDYEEAIAGQYAYRLIGQVLFYFTLRRHLPSLNKLELGSRAQIPEDLLSYWNDVRRHDFEALYQPNEIDKLIPVDDNAARLIRFLIRDLSNYDWNSLRGDVLGSIFENLIPPEERILLGQFYTPPAVAAFLVALAVDGDRPTVLDPGCGSGTFLMTAYDLVKHTTGLSHTDLVELFWGFDISAFAAELAVINIFRQDLAEYRNFPRIVSGDFFDRVLGETVEFPPARHGRQNKVPLPIPLFDAVVGNPPYLRSQQQDDLDDDYKNKLNRVAIGHGYRPLSKTDLFGFFLFHSLPFLKQGGRLGFVTSASWLTTEYGAVLQRALLQELTDVILVWSAVESFFSQVDVNTVLIVGRKRESRLVEDEEVIRFVSLKKKLGEVMSGPEINWDKLRALSDSVETAPDGTDNTEFRLKTVSLKAELQAIQAVPDHPRNWSVHLRAPLSYFDLFGDV